MPSSLQHITARLINISLQKVVAQCSRDTLVFHIEGERDFFDPTHFDRTTDFPHFGLCVRGAFASLVCSVSWMPIRSHLLSRSTSYVFIILVVLRAAHTHTHSRTGCGSTAHGYRIFSSVYRRRGFLFFLRTISLRRWFFFCTLTHTFSLFPCLSLLLCLL